MTYYQRLLENKIQHALERKKSILLLGARQTGKTTFIKTQCKYDLYYNFLLHDLRLQFETSPDTLIQEIKAYLITQKTKTFVPRIVIDEVQKVPAIVDTIQYLIDEQLGQFILTGSSARKLGGERIRNLLPGRVVKLQLDPLCLAELPKPTDLKTLLLFGSLPHIFTDTTLENKEEDLLSYVETYLVEEIRAEAYVRNLGTFSRFLQLVALEAGSIQNISKLSQEIGLPRNKIYDYYQILEECMIIDRITPITHDHSRRRLTKSDKYLLFDLGIRRICAKEGLQLSDKLLENLFEQFVGMELLRYIRIHRPTLQLKYWRDHSGPEIDYVLDLQGSYCPIEVKWSTLPKNSDCKHLITFMNEYPTTEFGYIVCRAEKPLLLHEKIMAIPWQMLYEIMVTLLLKE